MSSPFPDTFSNWLQFGQKLEAENKIVDAIAAYDRAIAVVRTNGSSRELADRRALGIAWMNRGNALQKLPRSRQPAPGDAASAAAPDPLVDSLRAYDTAIALFETLPYETDPTFRNHLGAVWLNRGHALLVAEDLEAAAHAFEQSVALLQALPVDTDPYYRLNLAGALTNLAHATYVAKPPRALAAARTALATLREVERAHEAFAAMSLRTRRTLVMAIGEILRHGISVPAATPPSGTGVPPVNESASPSSRPTSPAPAASACATPAEIAAEATDAIEEGLALTREFESQGNAALRPLASRLFRLGAQIYRVHQPHFVAEFVLETLSAPTLGADADFRATAGEALADTLADLNRPQLFMAGTEDSDRRREIAQSLRDAQERLSTLSSPPSATTL